MKGNLQRKRIGDLLVQRGLIRREWVDTILIHAEANDVRFGEAAVELGYITQNMLEQALQNRGKELPFFRIDPRFYSVLKPETLDVETVIQLGILPLGFKQEFSWFKTRKRLNIGVLDGRKKDLISKALQPILFPKNAPAHNIKLFQILPDEFIDAVKVCYGKSEQELALRPAGMIDESLTLYLNLPPQK